MPGAHLILVAHLEERLKANRRRYCRLTSLTPAPADFADHPVEPQAAYHSGEIREFLLPYEAARTAPDPDDAVARFLQTTYEAAAELGGWNRAALEDDPDRLRPQSVRRI